MLNPALNNYYDTRFDARAINGNFDHVASNYSGFSADTRNSAVTIGKHSESEYTRSSQRGPMLLNIPKSIYINSVDISGNPIVIGSGLQKVVGYIPNRFGSGGFAATNVLPLLSAPSQTPANEEPAIGAWPTTPGTANYANLLRFDRATTDSTRIGRFRVVKVTVDNNGTTIENGQDASGYLIGFHNNPNTASVIGVPDTPGIFANALRLGINSPGGVSSEIGVSNAAAGDIAGSATGEFTSAGLSVSNGLEINTGTWPKFVTVQNNSVAVPPAGTVTNGDLRVTIWFCYY